MARVNLTMGGRSGPHCVSHLLLRRIADCRPIKCVCVLFTEGGSAFFWPLTFMLQLEAVGGRRHPYTHMYTQTTWDNDVQSYIKIFVFKSWINPDWICFYLFSRNYHVFYYLLAGASEDERTAFHLKKPEEYHYLSQVGPSPSSNQLLYSVSSMFSVTRWWLCLCMVGLSSVLCSGMWVVSTYQ